MRPYPAEAARACEPMPALEGDRADDYAKALGRFIDRYMDCATRHKVLGDWVKGQ